MDRYATDLKSTRCEFDIAENSDWTAPASYHLDSPYLYTAEDDEELAWIDLEWELSSGLSAMLQY